MASLLATLASGLLAGAGPAGGPAAEVDANPCITPFARGLRCPDLVMRRPFGIFAERAARGRVVLRAGNSIDSIGAGPAELHGVRSSRRYMRARQRIYRRGSGRIAVSTGARLQFKYGHRDRFYWKFHEAARFELWSTDAGGRRTRLVRTGPKVAYCLRDLRRTRARTPRSPRRRVYPACNTSSRTQRVTLGTSPGWSDIYGPRYPEQYIDVTGLRGCFAYVHIADPLNGIYESDEDNNEAQVIVRLPYRASERRGRCRGSDRGRRYVPGDY